VRSPIGAECRVANGARSLVIVVPTRRFARRMSTRPRVPRVRSVPQEGNDASLRIIPSAFMLLYLWQLDMPYL
jgi:hypothetical protein